MKKQRLFRHALPEVKKGSSGGDRFTSMVSDDSTAVQDTPRLTLVVVDPAVEWTGKGPIREQIAEWTRRREIR